MKENKEDLQFESGLLHNDSVRTDEINPTELGHGNPMPEVVVSFLGVVAFLSFGLFLLLGDIYITPEVFGSQIVTKILVFFIMLGIALFFLLYAIALCKRLKIYYRQKREFENYPIDETIEDKIMQITCPKCGDVHDVDYPKCPKCGK